MWCAHVRIRLYHNRRLTLHCQALCTPVVDCQQRDLCHLPHVFTALQMCSSDPWYRQPDAERWHAEPRAHSGVRAALLPVMCTCAAPTTAAAGPRFTLNQKTSARGFVSALASPGLNASRCSCRNCGGGGGTGRLAPPSCPHPSRTLIAFNPSYDNRPFVLHRGARHKSHPGLAMPAAAAAA